MTIEFTLYLVNGLSVNQRGASEGNSHSLDSHVSSWKQSRPSLNTLQQRSATVSSTANRKKSLNVCNKLVIINIHLSVFPHSSHVFPWSKLHPPVMLHLYLQECVRTQVPYYPGGNKNHLFNLDFLVRRCGVLSKALAKSLKLWAWCRINLAAHTGKTACFKNAKWLKY